MINKEIMYIILSELDVMAIEVLENNHLSIEYKNGYSDACDDFKKYIMKEFKEEKRNDK